MLSTRYVYFNLYPEETSASATTHVCLHKNDKSVLFQTVHAMQNLCIQNMHKFTFGMQGCMLGSDGGMDRFSLLH